ncbi:hypothetical protein CSC2_13860 [Clostridium zeae]|uniref:Metallo-beta-lactamase domain-containing protein 1 n=1 Tax=Clostridium zeae TaxID=2759022 RepID=A0ABQ1E7U4_9CLOT|nr:MBL fold metallo-hydrolase [Clostridium zeae]GFZ30860.1 hypothetical protein CSC2_13860 [Clostridium zeae]
MLNTITNVKIILKGVGFPEFSGTCTYIKTLNHNILVDTGSFEHRGQLLENLNKLDLNPCDIDAVILTHMHIDHFSNLSMFENAKIYTTKAELKAYENVVLMKKKYTETDAMDEVFNDSNWKKFYNSGFMDSQKKKIYQSIAPLSQKQYDNIVFIDDVEKLFDTLEFIQFYGHSDDPRGVRINYGCRSIVICGDAVTNKRWFDRVIGQGDLPKGDYKDIVRNITIASEKTNVIIPGHGLPFDLKTNEYDKSFLL